MKTSTQLIAGILVCALLMAFTSISKIKIISKPIVIEAKPINVIEIPIEVEELVIETKTHSDFLHDIGQRESGNRYDIVNTYGYLGRYQFGESTLKGLGFKVTKEEFLNSPELQELAMEKLLLHNRKKLRKLITKYCNTEIDGKIITESGILAAAHLAGQGNVKKYFRRGKQFRDGYGTSLTSYLTTFSGYKIDLSEY